MLEICRPYSSSGSHPKACSSFWPTCASGCNRSLRAKPRGVGEVGWSAWNGAFTFVALDSLPIQQCREVGRSSVRRRRQSLAFRRQCFSTVVAIIVRSHFRAMNAKVAHDGDRELGMSRLCVVLHIPFRCEFH